jgi:hypothetical protein
MYGALSGKSRPNYIQYKRKELGLDIIGLCNVKNALKHTDHAR